MDIFKFIIDYFFIEPFYAPWDLSQKILFTTYSLMFVILSIDLLKGKWQMRKYRKQLEEIKNSRKITSQDKLVSLDK